MPELERNNGNGVGLDVRDAEQADAVPCATGLAARYEPGGEFVAAFTWDKAADRYRNDAVPQIPVANGIATVDQLSQVQNGLKPRMPVRELLTRIVESNAK